MKKAPIFLFALLVIACTPAAKAPVVDEAVTKQVFDHHVQTFKANDLEGVMADYTEESILITPDATFKGLAQIRENFVGAFAALPANGTTMTVTKEVISGSVAYFVWKATTPTLEFKYATDTFIIVDGKILQQTFAGDIVPLAAPTTTTPGE
jgi:hypothetical protein